MPKGIIPELFTPTAHILTLCFLFFFAGSFTITPVKAKALLKSPDLAKPTMLYPPSFKTIYDVPAKEAVPAGEEAPVNLEGQLVTPTPLAADKPTNPAKEANKKAATPA